MMLAKFRAATLSIALLAPCAAFAGDFDLQQLMAAMAQVTQRQSSFTESKTLALLKAPVESSGTLSYRRPDFVQKHVQSPQDETLTISGDQLTWRNNASNQQRTMRLKSNPPIWALVESIRATLAGDLPALQRFYQVRLEGDATAWTLALVPSDQSMRQTVQSIRIAGADDRMRTIDVLEAGGDRSVMTIKHD